LLLHWWWWERDRYVLQLAAAPLRDHPALLTNVLDQEVEGHEVVFGPEVAATYITGWG
jgi:hypothetical protein